MRRSSLQICERGQAHILCAPIPKTVHLFLATKPDPSYTPERVLSSHLFQPVAGVTRRLAAPRQPAKQEARSRERAVKFLRLGYFDSDLVSAGFASPSAAASAGAGAAATSSTHSRMAFWAESPGRCSIFTMRV